METYFIESPVGIVKIKGDLNGLAQIAFVESVPKAFNPYAIPDVLREAASQIKAYFAGNLKCFNLKLNPEGTPFQKQVWQQLNAIPYGSTQTYAQIAQQLGNPKVIRAAASANGKNPIAIVIPCHRVIGSDGSLTGYAGGLHRKKWLLAHESASTQMELF